MTTCGYLCPSCEGKGYDEAGDICQWCLVQDENGNKVTSLNAEEVKAQEQIEWIEKVHGRCCGDL